MKSSGKFHVLVTILHTLNFTKVHQFVFKISNGNWKQNSDINQGPYISPLNNNEKKNVIVLTYILSISMHLQNFIKIHQLVHKILSINKISISIKGHNSVENEQKILFNHPNLRLVNYYAYTKFNWNPRINSQNIEHKQNSDVDQGP